MQSIKTLIIVHSSYLKQAKTREGAVELAIRSVLIPEASISVTKTHYTLNGVTRRLGATVFHWINTHTTDCFDYYMMIPRELGRYTTVRDSKTGEIL